MAACDPDPSENPEFVASIDDTGTGCHTVWTSDERLARAEVTLASPR